MRNHGLFHCWPSCDTVIFFSWKWYVHLFVCFPQKLDVCLPIYSYPHHLWFYHKEVIWNVTGLHYENTDYTLFLWRLLYRSIVAVLSLVGKLEAIDFSSIGVEGNSGRCSDRVIENHQVVLKLLHSKKMILFHPVPGFDFSHWKASAVYYHHK